MCPGTSLLCLKALGLAAWYSDRKAITQPHYCDSLRDSAIVLLGQFTLIPTPPARPLSINKPSLQNVITSTCMETGRAGNQTHSEKLAFKSTLHSVYSSLNYLFFSPRTHILELEDPIPDPITFFPFLS